VRVPFTEQNLKDWAGWRAYRDGKSLFTRGVVEKVSYEHPFITGVLNLGPRGMRSRFEILANGLVENHCPCRDNQERGLICAHLVAMGMEVIRKSDATQQGPETDEERLKRLERSGRKYLKRAVRTDPSAVKARFIVCLDADWQRQVGQGHALLHLYVEYNGERVALSDVPNNVACALPRREEQVLNLVEDLAKGPVGTHLKMGLAGLFRVLRSMVDLPLHMMDGQEEFTVHEKQLDSVLKMDLDRDNGELLLSLRVDELPEADLFRKPFFLVYESSGWVFFDGGFWELASVVPNSLREVYQQEIRIPRETVPAFLMTELVQIEKYMKVESDISSDLFFMKPAKPQFHLVVKGSPASLAATLYARYNDEVELVAGRADMRGNFAIPDAKDLLRYRIRNMEAEKRAVQKLASVGFEGRAGDTLRNIVGPAEVLNFLGSGVPKIRRMGWKVELEGRVKPFAEGTQYVRPVVRVFEGGVDDYFDVSYEYEVEGGSISEREIQQALAKGESFIERDGRTILLDTDAIERAKEVFEDCAVGEGSRPGTFRMSSIYSSYVEASLSELEGIQIEATPSWLEKAQQQNQQISVEHVELSPKLNATLRSYQQEGVNWLRFLENRAFCGILADEMGLGKTLQTLAWLQLGRTDPEAKGQPALIICPTSLVENWVEEAARFTPDLKTLVLHGAQRHRQWKKVPTSDLVITSYALMRRDIERHLKYTYSVAILDEAQHIKNRATQNAVAAKMIQAHHRLVLSGTPIENGVSDLWSIMDFLMPGYLGDHKDFREFYELPILNGGANGEYVQSKLRKKLHPFLLRRLKKQVASDLPPKIERIAPCKLTQDQHKVYMQLLQESKQRIENMVSEQGFNKSRMEILKTLLRLRQTCCHIDLLHMEGVVSKSPSAKMELFFELLSEALTSKHRVLVFSQFTSMLAILRKEMEERGLKYCYLDGSTKDRQDVVKQFNRDHSIPVFLMSLKAGGTGLNLTGADMVIHFDPWWNPAVEDQATDRAHRIGQKRTVYSVKLISKGTVEEKVVAMQARKKGIIDSTLTTDEQVMQKLTWEDVQELLSL
jgi:superfamily II DNA or RNA helicase